LASDNAPEWLAWRHAIKALKAREGEAAVDVFVAIPCTAPLRMPSDLDACVEEFMKGEADVVFTVTAARRNPYFSMITLDDTGYAHPCLPRGEGLFRRQDAPRVYDIVPAAYVVNPRFIEEADNMFAGRIRTVEVPEDRAVDIDTEADLLLAEVLLGRRGAGGA
jgi:N-acylneuraminate cytidylyltransferase